MPTYNILLMGASYGSLLASKLLFGGHQLYGRYRVDLCAVDDILLIGVVVDTGGKSGLRSIADGRHTAVTPVAVTWRKLRALRCARRARNREGRFKGRRSWTSNGIWRASRSRKSGFASNTSTQGPRGISVSR